MAVVVVVASLVLAACGAGGNAQSGTGSQSGHGMMGGASGYHFSKVSCPAPGALPGQLVTVRLGDMGMTRMRGGTAALGERMMLRAAPRAFAAGTVSLVATNRGWRTHELVVLPLAAGQRAGQRPVHADGEVDEEGDLGEASASCSAGIGEGIRAGTVGWTTLTLAPGRYELVCNLRNHYANGMHQEIRVT
ncbi:MAG: hypothetical protein ABI807_07105 [Sporichthyaceae bacterium]